MARALALLLIASTVPAQFPPTWVAKQASPLEGRQDSALAYDSRRQRVVLFGGEVTQGSGSVLRTGDTWEWDGSTWVERVTVPFPPGRHLHAMAYDAARGRLVLFGGAGMLEVFGDTWEWDGSSWIEHHPAVSPPPVPGYAMAYDAARQRVVLLGSGSTPDTWEWDGSAWLERQSRTPPPSTLGHRMVYDPRRQRIVLFSGGFRREDPLLWEWDGTEWAAIPTPSPPPPRSQPAMVYDTVRGCIVLFGGLDLRFAELQDLWEWDGATWTQRTAAAPLGFRRGVAMAYDEARAESVLFGGSIGASYGQSDLWRWDGTTWSGPTAPPAGPRARLDAAVAWDEAREQLVMLACTQLGAGPFDDAETWVWDGVWWSQQAYAPPGFRNGHALAYDAARQRVVLFGGATFGVPGFVEDDTWEWDGSSWTQRQPAASPAPRSEHALAYDAARQRIVLFGGYTSGSIVNDTWEWDGAAWTLRQPAVSPLPRARTALAYDPARQRIVLFGGTGATVETLGDTWEWDGTTWTQRHPATRPSRRQEHTMAFDGTRGRVVLFGGQSVPAGGPPSTPLDDTWEWDGVDWSRVPVTVNPIGSPNVAMAYDATRSRLVLFGWRTWVLGPTVAAAAEGYGAGCAAEGAPPFLDAAGLPTLGNRAFGLRIGSAPAGAPAVFLMASREAALPLGACTLLIDPAALLVSLPTMTGPAGAAALPIPVPPLGSLVGLGLRAQAVVVDPSGSYVGLLFTRGLRILVGD